MHKFARQIMQNLPQHQCIWIEDQLGANRQSSAHAHLSSQQAASEKRKEKKRKRK